MRRLNLERFLAELQALAAADERPVETHAYGPGEHHVADLRLPDGEGPHPVAVVIHGGFWRAPYTRDTTAALAVDLARRGFASWNVEYRRVGCGGGVPETLDDLVAALAHLDTLDAPLDLDRTTAIGHSAGGHLALWSAGTGAVSAAVSLCGVAELAEAARAGIGQAAASEFVGGMPEERPEAYALADPLARLPTGVRQVLVHGVEDDQVPIEQSRRYAAAARAAGDPVELIELEGVGHFEPIDPRSEAWARAAAALAG